MELTKYEKTYVCAHEAKYATEYLQSVVDFLQNMDRPATCEEIGKFVFGSSYTGPCKESRRVRMGQMLRHLRLGGFVKYEEVPCGDPIEVDCYGVIPDNYGVPEIKVHDDFGNTYIIPNPNYKGKSPRWGHYTKTIQPTQKLWSWVNKD